MNAVAILPGEQPTMTSREIADLVELRHDNVKRTVDTLAAKGVIALPQTEEVLNRGPGPKTISVFKVGKRDSYVIVAQLSPQFTARLVDRWQELESRPVTAVAALPNFSDPVAAARAWADEVEAKRTAQLLLEAATPKVVFADALLNADGTTLVADVAKTIGVRVRKLYAALKAKGVILANNAPAAEYVAKGYFKEATYAFETKVHGTQIGHTARVTGRGIEFLRRFALRHADLLSPPSKEASQCKSLFEVH